MSDASSIMMMPPNGSTAPLRLPMIKDRHLELPAARMGMEMMAPSGTFCMAIPMLTAMALANDNPAAPFSTPANTTPTAIPSGRLWMVTARASIAVRDRWARGPSGVSVPICRWGVSSSMASKNTMPSRKPVAAGMTDHAPLEASISMAGMRSDHTDAATITPDAKPRSDFCTRGGHLLLHEEDECRTKHRAQQWYEQSYGQYHKRVKELEGVRASSPS